MEMWKFRNVGDQIGPKSYQALYVFSFGAIYYKIIKFLGMFTVGWFCWNSIVSGYMQLNDVALVTVFLHL